MVRLNIHLIYASTCFLAVIVLYVLHRSLVRELYVNNDASPFKTVSASVPQKGEKKDDPPLFAFANNQCDAKCCGESDLMCAGGCVCKTPEQEAMLLSRGYNGAKNGALEI